MLKRMEEIALRLMEFGTVLITKCRLAFSKLNIERCHALYTKVVESIRVGLIFVQVKLGLIGQQLLTTAHKTLQRVKQALKQGN